MGVLDRYNEKKKKTQGTSSNETSTSGVIQRYEQRKKYEALPTDHVNDRYIQSFVSDANRFFSTSEDDDKAYDRWKDLSTRADTINGWLYQNKGNLDSETYNSISNAVNTFVEATKGYSQFSSNDDYMRYVSGWLNPESTTDEKTVAQRQTLYDKNASRAKDIDKSLPWYVNGVTPNFIEDIFLTDEEEARRDEMEQLSSENKKYERTQGALDKYFKPETSEFTQAAANRNYVNPTRGDLWNYDMSVSEGSLALSNGGYFDEDGNIRNAKGDIVSPANAPEITDKLGMFLSSTDEDIAEGYNRLMATNGSYTDTWANLMQEGDVNAWRYLDDYEVNLYYYYLNTEGQKKAYEFLEAMTPELTRRETQKRTEAINDASIPAQIALNVASIPMNVVGGAVGLIDNVSNLAQGKDINPYSRANSLSNAASAIREDTAKDIDTATGGAAIPWLDFTVGDAYQAGMSFGDSALAALLPFGFGEVLLASGAATSEMKELYERGASKGQMLTGGTLAFAAEAVFEHFSIGELKKLKNMEEKAVKNIFDGFLRSLIMGGVEASEEVATEITNTISDALVMGSQSDWVDFETFTKNVLNAGLGGFLSGGVGGGVASGVNYAQYDKYIRNYGQSIIDADGVEDLKAKASETEDKSVARLSEKVAYDPSARNVGRLAKKVHAVTTETTRAKIAEDLVENGLTEDEAKRVADFTVKVSEEGYTPTAEETDEIEEITDKLPDVIPDEETSSETVDVPENTGAQVNTDAKTTENAPKNKTATESNFEPVDGSITKEESAFVLAAESEKYGAQSTAMVSTYIEGQDVYKYSEAYKVAYDMGKSGVSLSYAMNSAATKYLTESQRQIAYSTGADASNTEAKEKDDRNKKSANGKTGRKSGTVKGEGVTISDLKKTFNDTQNTAYKLLSTYAEVTGIDIVLYRSDVNENGQFEGAQGKFKWKKNTIYIDINAGLTDIKSVNDLAKYTMLRTFSHEFTHFIEKWNPIAYNEFRKVVFDTLTERDENVDELIRIKLAQDESGKMTYDEASREVIAEAMTDILPDSNFVQELAEKHKTIFQNILEKLKEFLADLKAYFSTLGGHSSREANALKEQVGDAVHYVESIVKLFDKVAVEAVETYQMAFATDVETTETESIVTNIADKNADLPAETSKTEQYEHFSITDNTEFGTLEITFDGKPPQAVRNAMKDKKFRWHKVKGVWFGKADRAEIATAIQNAYTAEAKADTEVKENAEQRTEFKDDQGSTPQGNAEGLQRASEEESNRSNLQSGIGGNQENSGEASSIREGQRGLNNKRFPDDAFIIPKNGSVEEAEYKKLVEYGIEGYVVKKDAWDRGELPAFANSGRIYIREGLSEKYRGAIVPHEATHVMKHLGYQPYLDFIERTAEMVNTSTKEGLILIENEAEHYDIDVMNVDENAIKDIYDTIYDEINATMYGGYAAGKIVNDLRTFLEKAFYDFDAYIKELSDIHEQFKKANKPASDFETAFWNASQEERDEVVEAINANTNKFTHMRTEFRGESQNISINEEENQNGTENADNQTTVSQPDADRQGDSRVLDEVETGDVSRDAQRGDTLDDAVQRERETARDDHSDDAGRSERGHGEGSGESADLRRDDGLTPEEASQKAEQLHEEVREQIEQQSTETPKGRNFVIGDSLNLPNGEKARYKVNVAAIRLVKKLEAEGRYATEFEQQLLSKYVGWGGLANVFDERKVDWSAEYKELKELLTEEEYAAARGSTLNAHYTDISVIKAMYDGLAKLGFYGGRMLEPSSGVGNFVGAMPAEMSAKVKSWTMVELDNITGLIAKYLYPNADVRIQGFEKANIPNNFMDVAISNVPFGNFPIADKKYPKRVTSAIHNYFFAKALDKVRPGGIVMFITSSYTMNSKDSAVRSYIMQRADLLGAIRLPDTAFKSNAGTEVVTDILILKKRAENTPYAGETFLEAPYTYPVRGNYNGAYINEYFKAHPEMVLGTPSMDGGMYRGSSLTYKALEGKGSLADQIREAFTHINGKMDYTAAVSPEKTNFAVERASKKTKQNGFVSREGKIFQNQDGSLVPVEVSAKDAERITGMLGIRDAAKDLLRYQQQGLKASEIKKARQTLNKLYDAFVEKYGYLNAPANKRAFKEDPDCYSLFALENWDSDKKKATKADIFSKNTVTPNRTVTSAKDVSEGLIVSVNQTGGIDVDLIARLTGKTADDVRRELIDSRLAFKNRNGTLETAESYLSGNVRAKLRDAEAMAPLDPDYQKNVEALKSVVPKDVAYQEIFVQPGVPWIPNSVYSDFAAYMLGGRNSEWSQDIDVTRNNATGNFVVELKNSRLKFGANNTQRWGTPRRSFLDLFEAMLNSKSVVIRIKLDDGTSVVDKDATAAANEKIENITKEFSEWLWKDEARRAELTELYNETFNSIVTPKYNGDNLTVNGANADKPLRPHQRDAVQRVISSGGNTLLAHKVGAGKTYEMAAAAMKLKELGLVKKPMFAVPKSLVAQWGKEFVDFFPTAKILVAEATDFTASNRKTFMNRIATGDYDAIIVSYEQFERLPMSNDFTRELYQEQIDSVIAAIEEAKAEKGGKSLSIKDLEKKRKSLETKIEKLTDAVKDEGNIDFEELGVDSLFIDEAHNFKNLFYTTSMTNVSGLGNKDGSKRAFDLYTKVRYLQKLNGGRGIVFATATPVMNSMSEMYIMQRYLQPDVLEQLGISSFDAWAKQFGEVVNGVEIKPSGQGYRIKQSFSRFKNMGELQLLFRNFADVLTDIPGLKIPKMKGGKVNVVVCEPGQFQKDYMKLLEKRADEVKSVDPSVDNMLKITSDGRKISYTQRMIDPTLPYEEGCKIYRCADNVVKTYKESAKVKGTQLIFCDMATPKGKSKTETSETDTDSGMDMESTRLYDDIKARLIEGGIPAKEIAFIHEADTDQKKKKLFSDVNEGTVRVLIGSTGKMGVGMNAQRRIVAIHHLDAPWRPGDVEQRNGRAYRQGNINEEVECFTYVTEGSFDARLWDILERKNNFITQIMNGENVGRETEDTGEVTLSAAEVKALASGSPLIMEQVQLDTDIKKLESLQRAHRAAVISAADRLEKDKGTIDILNRKIASGKADVAATVDTYSEGKFSMTLGKQTLTDKKEAGASLLATAIAKANIRGYTPIGNFAGFEMLVLKTDEGIKGVLQGKQSYPFNIYTGNPTFGITHLISVVEGISESVKAWNAQLEATKADLAEQEKLIAEPFTKQAELDQKRRRYKEVMDILNPKEEQIADGADDVQEQSRSYLNDADSAYMEAVKSGDMDTAQKMVNERAKALRAEVFAQTDVPTYRIRRGATPKKTIKVYKVFTLSETGKPSALFVSSQHDIPVGVWLDAQDTFHFTDQSNGHMYVPSTKNPNTKGGATGRPTNISDISDRDIEELEKRGYLKRDKNGKLPKTITSLAYRPGWHAGDLPFFPQGGMQIEGSNYPNVHRYNQVVFECEMIADNDYTDYHVTVDGRVQLHDMQEMPKDGSYKYSTNPMAKSADIGAWYIGSSIKIVRALTQEECDAILQEHGRPVQEWQAYQNPEELKKAKSAARAMYSDKKQRDATAKAAEYEYEHRYGTLDLDALGYDASQTDGGKKLLDAVTYDDNGNVIPLSQRFNADIQDVRYQQRTNALTDREVLELAAKEIRVDDLSEAEQNALGIFGQRLEKLRRLQEERAEQGKLYKEQQFGTKVDRNAAAETLNRMKVLDGQIQRATADVLTVEEKKVLQEVLKKARKVVERQERQHGKELLDRYRNRAKNSAYIKKYRERIRFDVEDLTGWILHPDNKDILRHVPDALKKTVIPFLSSINFMSKRSLKGGDATVSDKEFIKVTKALSDVLQRNIDIYGMYSGYTDLPPDFMHNLGTFIKTTETLVENSQGEFIINKMTAEELSELSKIIRALKKYIMQMNRFHNNAMYRHVYQAGDETISFLGGLDNAGSHVGKVSNFLFWQQMRPGFAFERFGQGGQAIYDELRRGQATLAFNTKEIQAFSEKTYTEKEIKAWENDIKEFSLGGDIVKIPVSGIMSLYELSKDPEALVHINGGGIRVATYTRNGKKISDIGHTVTGEELKKILSSLSERQTEVADKLQEYMATQGAKWGNHVSIARFGEELFTNPHYFPINSDGRHLQATAEEHPSAAALYALLNMSFTKSRKEGANNRIVIYSIFDVFANHMASMAQYNAMALPILDALKWFNYQQIAIEEDGTKSVLGSVRDQMSRVYGTPNETRPGSGKQGYAEIFVANIIKAFNGTEAQGTPYDTFGLKPLRRYNMAQVAYNFRVVVQQPLAITRAALLMDYRSILKGMKQTLPEIRKNIEEMQKYSGIAAWKSLGFYDVNISRGLTHLIKHDATWMDKIGDIGMLGAEKADLWAWASMWNAAKAEVVKKQTLKPESEEFYEAVTKLFEDVIYKTQVVDSVLTKNEFMRDKGFVARAIGSFMSEPTTTASMVLDTIDKFHLDIKRGMSKQQAWNKNKKQIGRMLYVYGVSAVILAAVQAAVDALRDDDEYESYPEKYLEEFIGNVIDELMPFNKLPVVSDFYEVTKAMLEKVGFDTYGNAPTSVFMQWWDSLVKGVEILNDKITGEDTNYTWYGGISKLLQAVSGMTGLPMAAATREIITFWNTAVGAMAPSLKLKTYEPSELSEIRYAYEDGYLSEIEATERILEKGLADTENEAYFIIRGWEAGEGYSRYDAVYDAIRNNGDIKAAMDELTSRGYTKEAVLSQVKSKIGEWYKTGEVTKQAAIVMLKKYPSMTSDEITETVNKWSSVIVTGIEYDEIDDEFMEGKITAARAVEMYMRYGSMTREKAVEKLSVLQFVKDNPLLDDITAAAVSAYSEYCKPVGLDPTIFYDAWKYKNTLSGTVKEPMMDYINSLPISAAQKDSLYFAFGWAESKLYEAPWR